MKDGDRQEDGNGDRYDRTRARRDQVRPRRVGAGGRPAARYRRDPDGGVDEPRRGARDLDRGPRLLLVAIARSAMAQGRDFGPGAAAFFAPGATAAGW